MQKTAQLVNVIIILFLTIFLVNCSSSQTLKNPAYSAAKVAKVQLTDKDIFDEELDKEITDYDIQEAAYLAKKGFHVPLNSSIILVQSGESVPDAAMQSEMAKYYQVSVYNGFPKVKTLSNRRKSKDKDTDHVIHNNYMKQLRLIAAKGGQRTIVVYWGSLENGVLDEKTNIVNWHVYHGGKLPSNTKSLRYLLKFTLVDVVTGNWSTYSPINIEVDYILPKSRNNVTDVAQIDQLIHKAYANAALLLAEKYKGK
ncbi:hypothetical protein [Gilliamella sp. Pas-s25]|uniref:hypothetical protein n=1 Tax=Gilliamella sp. Pas-s25 TaxID=2687310 RepID=UPI00135EA78A|nr:hypothetical protein [Gilliamella sp. Pas-s25]MWP62706.1 hypothetical protein [Gilliamella sp. Pas-s25]